MRAVVIGNIGVDEIYRVDRLPRPGETLLALDSARDLGGKGANQAIVLARAGCDVRLVAGLGRDAEAAWLRAVLALDGLEHAGLIDMDGPTDRSVIMVDRHGENMILSTAACALAMRTSDVDAALALGGDVAVLQGNLTEAITAYALGAARARGLRTVFNPAPVRAGFSDIWALADLVVLNRGEAADLTDESEPARAAAKIRDGGAGRVVVTLGAEGSLFLDGDGMIRQPARPARVVDTAGAGDTFVATLIAAGVLHGAAPDQALAAATKAAAITIGRAGTRASFPTRDEMAGILGKHQPPLAQPSTLDHSRA